MSTAALPAGLEVRVHKNVSGLPSGSLDAEPFKVTLAPKATVWSGPALATGGRFGITGVALTVKFRKANWNGVLRSCRMVNVLVLRTVAPAAISGKTRVPVTTVVAAFVLSTVALT